MMSVTWLFSNKTCEFLTLLRRIKWNAGSVVRGQITVGWFELVDAVHLYTPAVFNSGWKHAQEDSVQEMERLLLPRHRVVKYAKLHIWFVSKVEWIALVFFQ